MTDLFGKLCWLVPTGKKFKLLRSEKLYLSSEEKFISLRRKRELRNIDITEVDESRVTLPLYFQY